MQSGHAQCYYLLVASDIVAVCRYWSLPSMSWQLGIRRRWRL